MDPNSDQQSFQSGDDPLRAASFSTREKYFDVHPSSGVTPSRTPSDPGTVVSLLRKYVDRFDFIEKVQKKYPHILKGTLQQVETYLELLDECYQLSYAASALIGEYFESIDSRHSSCHSLNNFKRQLQLAESDNDYATLLNYTALLSLTQRALEQCFRSSPNQTFSPQMAALFCNFILQAKATETWGLDIASTAFREKTRNLFGIDSTEIDARRLHSIISPDSLMISGSFERMTPLFNVTGERITKLNIRPGSRGDFVLASELTNSPFADLLHINDSSSDQLTNDVSPRNNNEHSTFQLTIRPQLESLLRLCEEISELDIASAHQTLTNALNIVKGARVYAGLILNAVSRGESVTSIKLSSLATPLSTQLSSSLIQSIMPRTGAFHVNTKRTVPLSVDILEGEIIRRTINILLGDPTTRGITLIAQKWRDNVSLLDSTPTDLEWSELQMQLSVALKEIRLTESQSLGAWQVKDSLTVLSFVSNPERRIAFCGRLRSLLSASPPSLK